MSNRPYPDGIAWDEAWRQRLRAEKLEDETRWYLQVIAAICSSEGGEIYIDERAMSKKVAIESWKDKENRKTVIRVI